MKTPVNDRPPQRQIRGRKCRYAGLLLAGLLVGCVADPTTDDFNSAPQAAAPQSQPEKPAPAPTSAPVPVPAQPAPMPPPPPKIVSLPPIQLLGMKRGDILQHLGPPTFQRRDQTALLLRYREGGCILDLFLYPNNQGGSGKSVDYMEARSPEGEKIDTKPCIDAVRKAKTAG